LAVVDRLAWAGTVVGLGRRLVLVPAGEWVEVEMEAVFPGCANWLPAASFQDD